MSFKCCLKNNDHFPSLLSYSKDNYDGLYELPTVPELRFMFQNVILKIKSEVNIIFGRLLLCKGNHCYIAALKGELRNNPAHDNSASFMHGESLLYVRSQESASLNSSHNRAPPYTRAKGKEHFDLLKLNEST